MSDLLQHGNIPPQPRTYGEIAEQMATWVIADLTKPRMCQLVPTNRRWWQFWRPRWHWQPVSGFTAVKPMPESAGTVTFRRPGPV